MHETATVRRGHIARLTNFSVAFGLLALAVCVLVDCLSPTTAHSEDGPWIVVPGLGHDQFEQTFLLEDTASFDPDSLRTLSRTIEDLKESYASLELGYDRGRSRISNTVYATDAAWRNVTEARGRYRTGRLIVDGTARLEWKGDDERDSLSSSYFVTRLAATPRLELSDHWDVFIRGDWESTDYDVGSIYGLDYTRSRARAGLRYSGERLESIELSGGVTDRAVSDSLRLSYEEKWLGLAAFYWSFGATQWSATLDFAQREYDADAAERDHDRATIEIEARWSITPKLEIRAIWEVERWDYLTDSDVYYDFTSGRIEGSFKYRLDDQWQVGLDARTRWEKAGSSTSDEDDYGEFGAGPSVSWWPNDRIWLETASRWGERSYDNVSLIYDDFRFVQLEMRGDASLGSHFTVTMSISLEKENHNDPSRDSEYRYGSLAIRFPFRL